MPTIAQVYAANVMPRAISGFIGCPHTDTEKIEECRIDLLEFLTERESWGIVYSSQDMAWSAYKEWQIVYSTAEDYEHLDVDELETLDYTWEDELVDIFNHQMVLGNYNEYGGQL